MRLAEKAEREYAATLAEYVRFVKTDVRLRTESREGMVQVVDYDGQIVGSMGVETWKRVLETEAEPCDCDYELVEDGSVQRKRWFHEPGCLNG